VSRLPLLLLLGACSDYELKAEAEPDAPAETAGSPDIDCPSEVDFGSQPLAEAQAVSRAISIANAGSADLSLADLRLEGSSAFDMGSVASPLLPPGEATEVVVVFHPDGPGRVSAQLFVDSNDPDESTVAIALLAEITTPATDTGDVVLPTCSCPEGFAPREDDSECFRQTTEPAEAVGTAWEACPIVPYFAYGNLGAVYPGGSNVQDPFWGQNDGVPNGRLNSVGVWACTSPGSPTTGTNPVNTWIGFSVCVDIAADGDYLLGLGADNRTRFAVDGVTIYEQTSDVTANFNYWWMNVVSLTAGTHIIQIEGYNAGSIGGFGAEIAGPFTPGSLNTDAGAMAADYAGNRVWSTADAIGRAFPIGEDVAWTCPDGSTFDPCAEAPECVGEETTPCE
jgi:hypothetical protein